MIRNVILAICSLAVLIILFVVYTLLVGAPAGGRVEQPAMEQVPPQEPTTTQPFQIGGTLEVPGGGKIVYKQYDEHTGRPRSMLALQDWQPVSGAKNEIRVTGPELATLLPNGMIVTIFADEGQITVDRMEQSQMKPKLGWLAGNVRIIVDRATNLDRTPRAERPEDLITVTVDRLEFDLELGELKTEDRIVVQSDDFELAGSGLHLIWNQASNRIETLTLAHGEQLVLYAAAGMFGMKAEPVPTDETQPATTQAVAQRKPRRRSGPARPATAYLCSLTGGLVAEQYRGDERVGGLDADEVQLLFDSRGTDRFMRAESTRQPAASRPAREERQRLELHWSGPLELGPAPAGPTDEPGRRRFEALGRPVVMTRGEGLVRCGKVAYHDDTQRVWLYPTEGGTVEFGIGQSLSATAQSVYIDRVARIVKLIGDVELRSQRGTGKSARLSSIRCSYWGELHIAKTTTMRPAAADALVDVERLESATFVGDVQVDLGEQKLTSLRLDVGFRPDTGGQSFDELLDTATASGEVRLTSGDGRLTCGELELAFDRTPDHALYPRRMDAAGAVVISRKQANISGDRIVAELGPPPETKAGNKPVFVIQSLDMLGRAELLDPDNKIAARGQHIAAVFEGINQLAKATVRGGPDEQGVVHARPYTVRGGQIDIDRGAQSIHVDGPSRLAFKSLRSLQGRQREKPTPVVVSSNEQLDIDGRRNTVRFVGNVAARSEDEELDGDTLTLLLEDVQEPNAPPPADTAWRGLWRQMRGLVGGEDKPSAPDDLFALRVEGDTDRLRKEPVRLVAGNALVTSETYEPGDSTPAMHASISAPQLEVDIVNRQIVTSGVTELLMTDRRGIPDADPARETLGVASALLSRGASQTAIRCEKQMTYTLGPDGPGRRDTVVFDDRVLFVHRAGKEMVNLTQMLPQMVAKPELVETMKSRNASLSCDRLECWFAAEPSSKTPPRGGALTQTPLRLASLLATGSVFLRDQEESRVREVNAASLEFNREQSRVRVQGGEQADARVYFEDTKTGQFDVHAGRQLVINMQDGTIQSDRLEGEIRRK